MVDVIEWPDLPAVQQPVWPDSAALAAAVDELRALPPLVFAGECDNLTERLALAAQGQAFVLMGGDCAETFETATAEAIRAKLKTVLQMAIVLTYGASLPVVKIGRMAGQYFKPRSKPFESRDGVELASYFGDGVNALPFDAASRTPDPQRLVKSYHTASATLNLVRAFTQGGYADLRQVHAWNQDFVSETPAGDRYEQVAGEIDRALSFMAACGADPEEFKRAEFYASHEALVLDYEKALTRIDSRTGDLYDVGGHMVWIGERTRQLDGAHIDFAARISNPIGVKLGPTTTPEQAVEAAARGADYVGAGAVFPTGTKEDAAVIGLEGLAAVVAASPVPVVAIGGVTAENAGEAIRAGASGVAVVSAVFGKGGAGGEEAEIERAARAVRAAVDAALAERRR